MKWRRRTRIGGSQASVRFRSTRERSPWLLVVAAMVAAMWALAQQLGWPVAARAALAAIAAVTALLVPELRLRRAHSDRTAQLLGRVELPTRRDALPLVRDLRPQEWRIHESFLTVPYVPRDVEDRVDAVLSAQVPLLVVGHSMAGKTRLAAERVSATRPDARLLAPTSGAALRNLIDVGLILDSVVVWLDDLERFLKGDSGLDLGLLDRLVTDGAIVVATIRRNELSVYRPNNASHPPQWDVLRRFEHVALRRRLTPAEQDRARRRISSPAVLTAIDRYGLAEYLGGGLKAIDRFDDGETESPVGYALVRAAIDWRRAGLARLIPHSALVEALPIYLHERPEVRIDDATIAEGLAWATERINETVALLAPYETHDAHSGAPEVLHEAFDYLVDVVADRKDAAIPVGMWQQVMKAASAAEAVDVTLVADNYFIGRHAVMAQIAAWLAAPTNSGNALTVTGGAGSGKTSVLDRLALLADPATRELVTSTLNPRPTLPRFDLVTTAANKSAEDLMAEISVAANVPFEGNVARFGQAIQQRGQPFTAIIDDIDEARELESVIFSLRGLLVATTSVPLRLIVGARPSAIMLDSLVIDLDEPANHDPSDIRELVYRLLTKTRGSQYVDEAELAEEAARLIAQKSSGVFLFATLMTELLLRSGTTDLSVLDAGERGLATVVGAFLDTLGNDKAVATHLLITLAEGPELGMAAEEWSNAAQRGHPELADRARLLQILDRVAQFAFVATSRERTDTLRYRFAHIALRDCFRRRRP